jgi:hypothetical protein
MTMTRMRRNNGGSRRVSVLSPGMFLFLFLYIYSTNICLLQVYIYYYNGHPTRSQMRVWGGLLSFPAIHNHPPRSHDHHDHQQVNKTCWCVILVLSTPSSTTKTTNESIGLVGVFFLPAPPPSTTKTTNESI